ncbi:hypothetical protein PsorP6_016745 [Peronosclerospora sorghi]|uniref:Uncharacterized protein n=1 Tax=Peronosclerospora sorghi TaxID=230839 RepID=A0ACC0WC01_9STRA|nr:hypothetical protein PsorP6_016745 [Peronosclerospora sorghi]
MNDDWRQDGSLRGLKSGSSNGKTRRKDKGPQFTRVIPKFLQKYHQPPTIQAKFATLPKPGDEEDNEEKFDEVQQSAIDEYLAKQKNDEEKAAGSSNLEEDAKDADKEKQGKSSRQKVVQIGKFSDAVKKKRKRMDGPTLDRKMLLSFSMDDE